MGVDDFFALWLDFFKLEPLDVCFSGVIIADFLSVTVTSLLDVVGLLLLMYVVELEALSLLLLLHVGTSASNSFDLKVMKSTNCVKCTNPSG